MEHALQKIDPRILGENLKSARTDRGLTQNDAADHSAIIVTDEGFKRRRMV